MKSRSRCSISDCVVIRLRIRRDEDLKVVVDVLDRLQIADGPFGDLHLLLFELLFDGDNQVDTVEAVKIQVIAESRVGAQSIFFDIELLQDRLVHPFDDFLSSHLHVPIQFLHRSC